MKRDNMDFAGKSILILGATSDLASDLIRELDCKNINMFLTGRNQLKLKLLKGSITNANAKIIKLDLNIYTDIENAVNSIPEIDAIVSFAGQYGTLRISKSSAIENNNILVSNFTGPAQTIAMLFHKRKINKEASIVFISSIASTNIWIGNGLYGTAKAAIERFSKSIAYEYGGKKIRSNCIVAGLVQTSISNHISNDYINETLKRYPLGFGSAKNIAKLILFLLSTESNWITGQNIQIDGGFSLT